MLQLSLSTSLTPVTAPGAGTGPALSGDFSAALAGALQLADVPGGGGGTIVVPAPSRHAAAVDGKSLPAGDATGAASADPALAWLDFAGAPYPTTDPTNDTGAGIAPDGTTATPTGTDATDSAGATPSPFGAASPVPPSVGDPQADPDPHQDKASDTVPADPTERADTIPAAAIETPKAGGQSAATDSTQTASAAGDDDATDDDPAPAATVAAAAGPVATVKPSAADDAPIQLSGHRDDGDRRASRHEQTASADAASSAALAAAAAAIVGMAPTPSNDSAPVPQPASSAPAAVSVTAPVFTPSPASVAADSQVDGRPTDSNQKAPDGSAQATPNLSSAAGAAAMPGDANTNGPADTARLISTIGGAGQPRFNPSVTPGLVDAANAAGLLPSNGSAGPAAPTPATAIKAQAAPIASPVVTIAPATLDNGPVAANGTTPVSQATTVTASPVTPSQDSANAAALAPPQPAAPPAPAAQPAGVVFGIALGAAMLDQRAATNGKASPRDEALQALTAMAGSAQPLAMSTATGGGQQGTLDMSRDTWPQAMIDHIEALRDAANANDTSIRLMPDALGKVDISIRHDGDAVQVHFAAEVPATRQMIADAQPRLADAALARGLRLAQPTIAAGGGGSSNAGTSANQQHPGGGTMPQPRMTTRPASSPVTAAPDGAAAPVSTRLA